MSDNTSGSKTTSSYKKGSYTIDVLDLAGLDEETAKKVRSITFAQSSANGGARIYDMYVRVPATATGISGVTVQNANSSKVVKFIKNGKVVIMKNGVLYNVLGQKE